MDVIGNNIANVNTVGFKASRMTFADAMSQRLAAASGENEDLGRTGRNPMQVGLGVNIGSIDAIMTQGSAQRTDRALDATIQGEGFFVVSDNSGTFFTRAGNIDWNGHSFSINGMRLMGWNAIEDPRRPGQHIIEQGTVQPLVTGPEAHFMPPQATSTVNVRGNINVDDRIDGSIIRPVEFFDSLGRRYTADARFTWHPPENHPEAPEPGAGTIFSDNTMSRWTFEFLPTGPGTIPGYSAVEIFPEGDRSNGIMVDMQFGWPPDLSDSTARGPGGRIGFRPDTGLIGEFTLLTPTPGPGGTLERPEFGIFISVPALYPPSVVGVPPEVDEPPTFNTGMLRFCFRGMRQHMGERTNLQMLFADGNRSGTLQDISLGADGILMGRYSNAEMRPLGQIPLAMFDNPEGLERVGNNLWVTSANSGPFDGVGTHGDLIAGTLEMSNVQLSNEFTEMITTQRGFQANSRVITTSDEMLQELVNLKR
jgi:flagellar hook protein FlgE